MNIDIEFRDNVISIVPLFTMIFEKSCDERYKKFLKNLFYEVGTVELWWDITTSWDNTFDLNIKITHRGQKSQEVVRTTILVNRRDNSFHKDIKEEILEQIKINGFNQVNEKSQCQLNITLNKGDITNFMFLQIME